MTRDEIIQGLEYCISHARFPREDCEQCPLLPAQGEGKECTACIDNLMRNAAWMLGLWRFDVQNDTKQALVLDIPKGYARFGIGRNGEGKMAAAILFSDTKSEKIGIGVKLPKNENCLPVLYIPFEDYRQAEAYSKHFADVAEAMKKGADDEKGAR